MTECQKDFTKGKPSLQACGVCTALHATRLLRATGESAAGAPLEMSSIEHTYIAQAKVSI